MDKSANPNQVPKGAAYCERPGTACHYGPNDICVNCLRKKGWRELVKSLRHGANGQMGTESLVRNLSGAAYVAELQQVVALLQDAVAYARNRLDVDKAQVQVAGDLAIAHVQSVARVGQLGRITERVRDA